jgi:hypothetical protein
MGTSSALRGINTRRTNWLTAMPCAALLLSLGAYGCEGHSGVPGGTSGNTGQGGANQDGSGIIIITGSGGGPGTGMGGHPGNPMDAAMRMGDAGPRPTDPGDAAPPRPHDAAPPPPPHPGDAAPPPRRADGGP